MLEKTESQKIPQKDLILPFSEAISRNAWSFIARL